MKLESYNETQLEMLLEKATQLSNLNREAYFATETKDQEGVSLFRYTELTNVFYVKMLGISGKQVRQTFGTPGSSGQAAWYRFKDDNRETSLKGPEGYSGYIPDCVEAVVINEHLSPKEKHDLLKIMMLDLAKLKSLYDFKNQLFPLVEN